LEKMKEGVHSLLLDAAQRMPGWWRMRSLLLPHAAALHRRRLGGVTFIGITGSAGKTTTKLLTTAVLSIAGRIRPWAGTMNNAVHIMSVVFATKRTDDYCVIEFSAGSPGSLDRSLATVKPRIGVVTSIGTDHLKAYHSIGAIAEEKAKLIACLPQDGIAVLNADDPLVISMASKCSGRVLSYGTAEGAFLRAEDVRSAWPDRLSLWVICQNQKIEVKTQLCGTHWTTAVLAALTVGVATGIPLEAAARAVESVEAYPSRMYPITCPDGVSFVVDDWKSSVWTLDSVFDFVKHANATRKFIVLGTLSDYAGNAGYRYEKTARTALVLADHVIFVGPMATHALRAKNPNVADRLHVFSSIKDASDYLGSVLRSGDLVVLKGSVNADHLGRLAHHHVEAISCWSMTCRKNMPCSSCPELRISDRNVERRQLESAVAVATIADRDRSAARRPRLAAPFEVLVGIGNPGSRYKNTPHNVGFEVVDAVAKTLGAAWEDLGDVVLAFSVVNSRTILLIKPQRYVNNLGKVLKTLAEDIGFTAQECLLLQDDIHLPLGKLRSRARGSDGGHKGVRSVLVEFQTNEFRRLKIGVAQNQSDTSSKVDYLVTPFSDEEAAVIEVAIEAAVERLMSTVNDAVSSARLSR
jgi:UDP-N-acetylmuramoyl-tripeptide--D-alanyl-D-alanine ligase